MTPQELIADIEAAMGRAYQWGESNSDAPFSPIVKEYSEATSPRKMVAIIDYIRRLEATASPSPAKEG